MKRIALTNGKSIDTSAASGLLLIENIFYIIADDELSLLIYDRDLSHCVKIQLMPGQLPQDTKQSKKVKPDFEALLELQDLNSILVIPSGSKPNRKQGVLVNLQDHKTKTIDFAELFNRLKLEVKDLNIEGAVVSGNCLKLLQRGNGPAQQNLLINLDLQIVLRDLRSADQLSEDSYLSSEKVDLGKIQDINLCFTDATIDNKGRIWYLAAAEGGKSTYEDGKFFGARLGCLNAKNQIVDEFDLSCPEKPEGLAMDFTQQKFFIVTDADDPSWPAKFYEGTFDSSVLRSSI